MEIDKNLGALSRSYEEIHEFIWGGLVKATGIIVPKPASEVDFIRTYAVYDGLCLFDPENTSGGVPISPATFNNIISQIE